MEEIRKRAVGGLLAVPRVPVGVGGLLVGVREKEKGRESIRILDSIEIPCSHSGGPSFSLTPEEKNECQNMMIEAGEADGTGKVTVVGWYCSKTRGDGNLTGEDLNFHREFFPEPWHLVLIVRPTALDDMPATVYRRNPDGQLAKAIDCVVYAWRPKPPAPEESPTEPEAPQPPAAQPGAEVKPIEPWKIEPQRVEPAPVPVPAHEPPRLTETTLAGLVGALSDNKPKPAPAARPSVSPLFNPSPLEAYKPGSGPNRILIGAAGALLVLLLALAAFFTRDSWLPRPPLTMTSTVEDGTMMVRWNAEALRGIDHASLNVSDEGKLQTIDMDRFQINSGFYNFTPKGKRVTVKLDAGTISGITSWFAPSPDQKPAADGAQAAQRNPPSLAPATQPSAGSTDIPGPAVVTKKPPVVIAVPQAAIPAVPRGTLPQADGTGKPKP